MTQFRASAAALSLTALLAGCGGQDPRRRKTRPSTWPARRRAAIPGHPGRPAGPDLAGARARPWRASSRSATSRKARPSGRRPVVHDRAGPFEAALARAQGAGAGPGPGPPGPGAGRPLPAAGEDRGRQPSGIRRCRRRPADRQGQPGVGAGRRQDRPARPGLCQRARADLGPHRPGPGDRGQSGGPGRIHAHGADPAARSGHADSASPSTRCSLREAAAGRRPSRRSACASTAPATRPRASVVLRRFGGSGHGPGDAARPVQQSRRTAAAGHVRARQRRAGVQSNAIFVPQRAVMRGADGQAKVLVAADGKAQERPVQTGAMQGSEWQITQGLAAGDQVIVDGAAKIPPGTPLRASGRRPGARPASRAMSATAPRAAPHPRRGSPEPRRIPSCRISSSSGPTSRW